MGLPAVARQLKRLLGPCGRTARQDVVDADFAACVVYCKAKKSGKEKKEEGELRKNKGWEGIVGGSMASTGVRGF